MTPKDAWRRWLDLAKREADDLDRIAKEFDAQSSRPMAVPIYTDDGRAAYQAEHKNVACSLRASAERLRASADARRDLANHARWLGSRPVVLDVVAIRDAQQQSMARENLSEVTSRALTQRCLIRGWHDSERIDRIVDGARLYVASKNP